MAASYINDQWVQLDSLGLGLGLGHAGDVEARMTLEANPPFTIGVTGAVVGPAEGFDVLDLVAGVVPDDVLAEPGQGRGVAVAVTLTLTVVPRCPA